MIFSCSDGRSGSFVSGCGYLCKGGCSGSSAKFPGSSASTSSNVSASCQSSSTGGAMGSGASAIGGGARGISWSFGRQHFLYFLPLPQGQGSLRPAFIVSSFPHLPRAGNRNPLMIWQSRELVCMPAHITCLMASWPTREKAAVLTVYGFSAKKDLLTQLLELNLAVAQRLEKSEPVPSAVIPAMFPKPETLSSD